MVKCALLDLECVGLKSKVKVISFSESHEKSSCNPIYTPGSTNIVGLKNGGPWMRRYISGFENGGHSSQLMLPIQSMYGIFTLNLMVNAGTYTIVPWILWATGRKYPIFVAFEPENRKNVFSEKSHRRNWAFCRKIQTRMLWHLGDFKNHELSFSQMVVKC